MLCDQFTFAPSPVPGVKMGQGKGNIEFFVARVPAGRVMFKLLGRQKKRWKETPWIHQTCREMESEGRRLCPRWMTTATQRLA